MKKKIILSILIIALCFIGAVYATEVTNPNDGLMVISDNLQVVDADDFQAGDIVTVENKTVNGNAFAAGERLTFSNVTLNGDLFVAGQYIDLKNVNVTGSVFVAGEFITLTGASFSGNLYVAGSEVSLVETTIQDVFSASAELKIDGGSNILRTVNAVAGDIVIDNSQIGRNANLSVDELNIGPAAKITGALFYSSEEEANISDVANIGNVNYTPVVVDEDTVEETSGISVALYSILVIAIKAVFVCGFIFLFAKGFIEQQKVKNIVAHLGVNAAKGLLWAIVVPIISILLLCSGVAVGLSFSVLAIYFIIFNISSSLVAVSIGATITQKMEYNAWRFYGITLLVALIIAILEQIPTLGGIITVFVGLAGMGLIFSSLKTKKATKEEPKVETEVV